MPVKASDCSSQSLLMKRLTMRSAFITKNGVAIIDNTIDGVNFNDQSTAGSATITNSFSGLTFFNDQSTAGSATIQLGSFPSEAEANVAWTRLSKRFSYLAPLGKGIAKADLNGKTFYRLRVNAGSNGQARELCGKLKAAGEACFLAGG